MGEAKKRGTLEQRQAVGIAKAVEAAELRKLEQERYEASLTDAQRERRHKTRMMLAAMSGIASSVSSYR